MSDKAVSFLRKDPVMAVLVERHGQIALNPRRVSTFESLTDAIIHQQLSGKAAGTILGRFRALYPGKRFPSPDDVLRTQPENLRKVGFHGQKRLISLISPAASKTELCRH